MSQNAKKISAEEFLQFNEHLLGLVKARVPLDEGLREIAKESTQKQLKGFSQTVADGLKRGLQLSDAVERLRPHVSDYYIALIRAGEKGGSLAEVLHHIVRETRRQIDHRRSVVSALLYPAGVVLIASIILYLVAAFVIPEFKNIFREIGAGELPQPTQFVMDLFTAFKEDISTIIAIVGCAGIFLVLLEYARFLKPVRDALMLHMPVIGKLVYTDTVVSFCRCMGFLLTRHVPMADALYLTRSVIRNAIAKKFTGDLLEQVKRGESLGKAIEANVYLPGSTFWMIRLSEDRGDLPQTLLDLADFYEDKQIFFRRNIQGLLEPILIAMLGVLVGFLIISLYLPLFTIPKLIR